MPTNATPSTPEQIEALRAEVLEQIKATQNTWIEALNWAAQLGKADAFVLTNEHHHLVDNTGRLLPGLPEYVRHAATRSRPPCVQWISAKSQRSGETLKFRCYPMSLRDYIANELRLYSDTATWLAGKATTTN